MFLPLIAVALSRGQARHALRVLLERLKD
jgi:hypothetical protein